MVQPNPHHPGTPQTMQRLPLLNAIRSRTCNDLGVCQHPQQCSGKTCYRMSAAFQPTQNTTLMPVGNLPATTVPSASAFMWLGLAITVPWVILLGMGAGYLWERFGPVIKAAFASLLGI